LDCAPLCACSLPQCIRVLTRVRERNRGWGHPRKFGPGNPGYRVTYLRAGREGWAERRSALQSGGAATPEECNQPQVEQHLQLLADFVEHVAFVGVQLLRLPGKRVNVLEENTFHLRARGGHPMADGCYTLSVACV